MASEGAEHLRALFVGVAPERTSELEEFWERFGPVVQIVLDDDRGEAPVMEAGMYRYLRFNHRNPAHDLEAAAMAGVPLVGTSWIPGQPG